MPNDEMAIIHRAIASHVARRTTPVERRVSSDPLEIDIALRCAELGDVAALQVWLERWEDNKVAPAAEDVALLAAMKQMLASWRELEVRHGDGALLDYQHALKSSPPQIIGPTRIVNAAAFQMTRKRVPGDCYWALQFG